MRPRGEPRPIEIFNRYTGEIELERVYGESWLRFAYERPLGRLGLHALGKRAILSRVFGWRMRRPSSAHLVGDFVERYGIDMGEAKRSIAEFSSFNDFFCRELLDEARPINEEPASVVFPADGRHLGFPDLGTARPNFVKRCAFELPRFLGNAELAARYEHGTLLVSRLAPVDYHRFHFPVSGHAEAPRPIDGALYSVSPIALRTRASIYMENKRWISVIQTRGLGLVTMVEIGATNVGSLRYSYEPGFVDKGDEKGLFEFGGSSVVSLFEAGRVRLSEDLIDNTSRGRELYAHVGDIAGRSRCADSDTP